jgi:hypothetical protein
VEDVWQGVGVAQELGRGGDVEDDPGDAGLEVAGDLLADVLGMAAEPELVDEVVGERGAGAEGVAVREAALRLLES